MLAIPTFFDLIATVLMNIGLLSVTASVYQMMRGAEMLFAAVFAVTFLHRSLNRFHLMGILCCMVSAISCQLPSQLMSLATGLVTMSPCHPDSYQCGCMNHGCSAIHVHVGHSSRLDTMSSFRVHSAYILSSLFGYCLQPWTVGQSAGVCIADRHHAGWHIKFAGR